MNPKHTPTPWFKAENRYDYDRLIRSKKNHYLICSVIIAGYTNAEANANADLIIRAVNAHEALIEALEATRIEMVGHTEMYCQGDCRRCKADKMAHAALKLARGKE